MTLRPLGRLASIGWALALATTACSSSSSSGTGGAGGTIVPTGGASGALGGATGTAGTSGAPGGTTGSAGGATGSAGTAGGGGTTGGAGGAGGAVSCGNLPACVASIVEACPLSPNNCLEFAFSSNPTAETYQAGTDYCFASAVKAQSVVMGDLNGGPQTRTITAIKSGVPCFSLDGTSSSTDTTQILAFRDASGAQVATFSTDTSTFPNVVTVTCTTGATAGQAVVVSDFGGCGNPANPESTTCVGGGNCKYP